MSASTERQGGGRWAGTLLALPAWLVLGGLLLLPLAILLGVSFRARGTYGGLAPIADWGEHLASGAFLANYAASLQPLYLQIHWRSLWMALLTTALCLLVGYPLAYTVARLVPPRRRSLLLALLVVPLWTSFLVRTYAWMLILRDEGVLNRLLIEGGLLARPLELLYTPLAVMIGLVYGELPFMVLPLYASLEKLETPLLEASADLGARPAHTFWRVTLPLTVPGIATGALLVFIPALGQFVVSDLLGGARTMLTGNLIQNQFAVARNRPFGAALAFELMAGVSFALAAYAWLRRRRREALW